jgi:hypothetical protein
VRDAAIVGGLAAALAFGATTGITTQQARTAAPTAVTGSSASEGSSLSFARADHQHGSLTAPVITGALDAQGTIADSTGNLTLGDAVDVTGAIDLQGSIADSTGNLTLGDAVDISGAVVCSSTMRVNSTSDLRGDVFNGTAAAALLLSDVDGVWIGNGAGGSADGQLNAGTLVAETSLSAATASFTRTVIFGAGAWDDSYDETNGILTIQGVTVVDSTSGGTVGLSGGTGTATVRNGARCVCTDTTANASVKCAVSGTTLTITGTTTDTIAYFCF